MELSEYQLLWGKFPLDYDPFPLIPSVEAVGITPGKTTQDEVEQLLGNPDRIVHRDRGVAWRYYVEPDLLGRLVISFDADGIVATMSNNLVYPVPEPLLLESAVKQYGQPDILHLMPGLEGQKYTTLALLYLDRGLRVATRCFTPACQIVKRDAVVEQKWYFRPMPLSEYQAMFSSQNPDYEPAYVEWHGFDD